MSFFLAPILLLFTTPASFIALRLWQNRNKTLNRKESRKQIEKKTSKKSTFSLSICVAEKSEKESAPNRLTSSSRMFGNVVNVSGVTSDIKAASVAVKVEGKLGAARKTSDPVGRDFFEAILSYQQDY